MSGAGAGTPAGDAPGVPGQTVLVLADDLIWATRLVGQLRTLGAVPLRVGSSDAFAAALLGGPARHAVVDLTARAYDGVAEVARARAAGLRVLAVGQHDDRALRAAARAAGAERVLAYRKLFEDGHAALAAWLRVAVPAAGSLPVPPRERAEVPRP